MISRFAGCLFPLFSAGLLLPLATAPAQDALRTPGFSLAYMDRSVSPGRSEEHTSELQSQSNLVCRLLLEKKNANIALTTLPTLTISIGQPPGAINSLSASKPSCWYIVVASASIVSGFFASSDAVASDAP